MNTQPRREAIRVAAKSPAIQALHRSLRRHLVRVDAALDRWQAWRLDQILPMECREGVTPPALPFQDCQGLHNRLTYYLAEVA